MLHIRRWHSTVSTPVYVNKKDRLLMRGFPGNQEQILGEHRAAEFHVSEMSPCLEYMANGIMATGTWEGQCRGKPVCAGDRHAHVRSVYGLAGVNGMSMRRRCFLHCCKQPGNCNRGTISCAGCGDAHGQHRVCRWRPRRACQPQMRAHLRRPRAPRTAAPAVPRRPVSPRRAPVSPG